MPELPRLHVMTVPGDPRRDALVADYVERYDACVHADPERNGILWNHRTILDCMAQETDARWHLNVQDDVVGLPGWEKHLQQVMWYARWPFVSLGHTSNHGLKLVERGIPFGLGVNATWGQAMLYRHDVLPSYRRLVEDVWEMDAASYWKWDDGFTAVHNLLHGTRSVMTSRALFEHQDWDSTVGNVPGQWRHAAATISTHPGPAWGARPATGPVGTSPDAKQKELARRLAAWRKGRA